MLSTFYNYASVNSNIGGDGGASRPLLGMRARRNSTETQHSEHTLSFGPEVKNGRSVVP